MLRASPLRWLLALVASSAEGVRAEGTPLVTIVGRDGEVYLPAVFRQYP